VGAERVDHDDTHGDDDDTPDRHGAIEGEAAIAPALMTRPPRSHVCLRIMPTPMPPRPKGETDG
jgi:hypothetical protein